MNVLDLFSGIGGFSLGLERAGMRTAAFCEIEPYCRAVLRKHWPDVPIFEDVRELTAADVPGVDVICGGFPCQDISFAGKGAGIEGERSGLWRQYARLVGEIRPRYVIVENVAALLGRGLSRVLGDLAALGYDAEWQSIPAAAVGAPHIRDRIWILAYPGQEPGNVKGRRYGISGCDYLSTEGDARNAQERREDRELVALVPGVHPRVATDWWLSQSSVARTINGVSRRLVDARNGALGNSVVPVIPEIIGRAIMNAERNEKEMQCS
jgi:DNA (cytosine-5)-methyltransferase 1